MRKDPTNGGFSVRKDTGKKKRKGAVIPAVRGTGGVVPMTNVITPTNMRNQKQEQRRKRDKKKG